jgi:transcription elongation factor GreA
MNDIFVSRERYEKLREELEQLKVVKRHKIAKDIERAREMGDLSENAEYDAAKEAQAKNEKRISDLTANLSRARLLEEQDLPHDVVLIGASVDLKDLDSGDEFSYTLLSELEADFSKGQISVNSPVGRALLNHKAGDEVDINIPAGTLRYKILKISR